MRTKKQARVSCLSPEGLRQDRKEYLGNFFDVSNDLREKLVAGQRPLGTITETTCDDASPDEGELFVLVRDRTGEQFAELVFRGRRQDQLEEPGWTRIYQKWVVAMVDAGVLSGELEYRLLLRLLGTMRYGNRVTVSSREIARAWGHSVHSNIVRTLQSLERKDVIKRLYRDGNKGVVYMLSIELAWKGEAVDRWEPLRQWRAERG